jgi:hypothetical protein
MPSVFRLRAYDAEIAERAKYERYRRYHAGFFSIERPDFSMKKKITLSPKEFALSAIDSGRWFTWRAFEQVAREAWDTLGINATVFLCHGHVIWSAKAEYRLSSGNGRDIVGDPQRTENEQNGVLRPRYRTSTTWSRCMAAFVARYEEHGFEMTNLRSTL